MIKYVVDSVYYVYSLIDPRTSEPFYIGKGKGKRMFQHVRNVINRRVDNPIKQAVIQEIMDAGFQVGYRLEAEGLSEKDAFKLEAKLISSAGLGKLTNLVSGRADALEQSKVWARMQLSQIIPFEEWKRRTNPSPFYQKLYRQVKAELEDIATNGWTGELTMVM